MFREHLCRSSLQVVKCLPNCITPADCMFAYIIYCQFEKCTSINLECKCLNYYFYRVNNLVG